MFLGGGDGNEIREVWVGEGRGPSSIFFSVSNDKCQPSVNTD